MKVPYINIKKQYKFERTKLLKVIDRSLNSGSWVGGKKLKNLKV